MISQPARLTSSPGLRQLAARAGNVSRDALLFPSARSLPRGEAGTADRVSSSSRMEACPGLTILIRCVSRRFVADRAGGTPNPLRLPVFNPIRCGSFEVSSASERATSERDVRGGSRRSLSPVKFSPRANAGFQARQNSRRNVVKSFPSHQGNSPFAANQRSERCTQDVAYPAQGLAQVTQGGRDA